MCKMQYLWNKCACFQPCRLLVPWPVMWRVWLCVWELYSAQTCSLWTLQFLQYHSTSRYRTQSASVQQCCVSCLLVLNHVFCFVNRFTRAQSPWGLVTMRTTGTFSRLQAWAELYERPKNSWKKQDTRYWCSSLMYIILEPEAVGKVNSEALWKKWY